MYHADARVDAWLYSAMADAWAPWLPSSAIDTLRAYGYYTALVEKGLRIISLNTNLWIAADWLKIARHEDINHQVEWLSETLEQAERDNEKVYIIGHMPLGDDDQDDDLTMVIRLLIHRYRKIIDGLFFGHKHEDIIKLVTDPRDNKTPVSTIYVAPAFTPFQDRNPSFRIYEASSESKEILDFHQYRLAPGAFESAVSTSDKLDWKRVYSARSEYGLSALNAHNWQALTARARHDSQLHNRWASHTITGSTSDRVKPPTVGEMSCYVMSPSQSVYEACIVQIGDDVSKGTPSMWSF
jgi:sphingomyelin phosphodiesterase